MYANKKVYLVFILVSCKRHDNSIWCLNKKTSKYIFCEYGDTQVLFELK